LFVREARGARYGDSIRWRQYDWPNSPSRDRGQPVETQPAIAGPALGAASGLASLSKRSPTTTSATWSGPGRRYCSRTKKSPRLSSAGGRSTSRPSGNWPSAISGTSSGQGRFYCGNRVLGGRTGLNRPSVGRDAATDAGCTKTPEWLIEISGMRTK